MNPWGNPWANYAPSPWAGGQTPWSPFVWGNYNLGPGQTPFSGFGLGNPAGTNLFGPMPQATSVPGTAPPSVPGAPPATSQTTSPPSLPAPGVTGAAAPTSSLTTGAPTTATPGGQAVGAGTPGYWAVPPQGGCPHREMPRRGIWSNFFIVLAG